jgi:hypothetical protein
MTIIESRPWDFDEALDDFVDEWLEEKEPFEIITALAAMIDKLEALTQPTAPPPPEETSSDSAD